MKIRKLEDYQRIDLSTTPTQPVPFYLEEILLEKQSVQQNKSCTRK
ncbi:hypothetical protein [Telluribacter humicola]|nr:hypothetical protein [Telluribacter humicola]